MSGLRVVLTWVVVVVVVVVAKRQRQAVLSLHSRCLHLRALYSHHHYSWMSRYW
jgi:hypothetical protein